MLESNKEQEVDLGGVEPRVIPELSQQVLHQFLRVLIKLSPLRSEVETLNIAGAPGGTPSPDARDGNSPSRCSTSSCPPCLFQTKSFDSRLTKANSRTNSSNYFLY